LALVPYLFNGDFGLQAFFSVHSDLRQANGNKRMQLCYFTLW